MTDDLLLKPKGVVTNTGAFMALDKSSITAFFRAKLKHYLPSLLCSLGYNVKVVQRVKVDTGSDL